MMLSSRAVVTGSSARGQCYENRKASDGIVGKIVDSYFLVEVRHLSQQCDKPFWLPFKTMEIKQWDRKSYRECLDRLML